MLSFQSLSALTVEPIATLQMRLPVWTAQGYRNVDVSALQNLINAPVYERLEEIGSEVGPSLWPVARRISLAGDLTGYADLDGSADVTLTATLDTSALNFPADSVALDAVVGLSPRLATIEADLDELLGDAGPLTAPLQVNVPADAKGMIFTHANGSVSELSPTSNGFTLTSGAETATPSSWRFNTTGELSWLRPDGTTYTFLSNANFDPSSKLGVGATAVAAQRLATARTISLSGRATGSVAFNGTGNVDISVTTPELDALVLGGMPFRGELADATSLNAALNQGVYVRRTTMASSTAYQYPVSTPGMLVVLAHDNNVRQSYQPDGTHTQYHRYYDGANWSPWTYGFNTGNFNPADYSLTSHTHDAGAIVSGVMNRARITGGTVVDSRGNPITAGTNARSWRYERYNSADVGLTAGRQVVAMTITPGAADADGLDHQLIFDNTELGLHHRLGSRASGWGAVAQLWDSGNFNPGNPVPTTGVLQIGNTAGSIARIRGDGMLQLNDGAYSRIITEDLFNPSVYVTRQQSSGGVTANADSLIGTLSHAVSGDTAQGTPAPYMTTWNLGTDASRDGQFSWNYSLGTRVHFRSRYVGANTDPPSGWKPWVELWHSDNFNPANYMPSAPRLGAAALLVTDWNNALENGWYRGQNLPNAAAPGWNMVTVTRHDADNIQQEAFVFSGAASTTRFRRQMNGGVWGAWTSDVTFGTVNANNVSAGYVSGAANSIGCSNWFRTVGNTGIMFTTYGGGIYQQDSTFVRTYNNKAFSATYFLAAKNDNQPQLAANQAAYQSVGNYGGGYGMIDGENQLSLYSAFGNLTFAFGKTSLSPKAQVSTEGVYSQLSDLNYKDQLTPFVYNGPLTPLNFTWKESGAADSGFGAQHVLARYPNAVAVDYTTGQLMVKQSHLIAIVSAQANQLEERTAQLERRDQELAILQARFEALLSQLGIESL